MAVTWSAVALSSDFAAAMSSADGISGAAGRWMVRVIGVDDAWAGRAKAPENTTAVHNTAAFRPDPDKPIRRTSQDSQAGERGLVAARRAPLLIAQQSEAT